MADDWRAEDAHDPALRDLHAEMVAFSRARADGHIILSCEELANTHISDYSDQSLGRLRAFLEPWLDDIRIIAYLRSPQDYYLPIMQESLKRSVDIVPPGAFRTEYSKVIGRLGQALGAPASVRVFDRAQLSRGDLIDDFFHEIRDLVDIDATGFERRSSNETLPGEILFLLDLARHASVFPDAPADVSRDHAERFWRGLRDASAEAGALKKPVLFASAARAVADGNRDDLTALSREYGLTFPDYRAAADPPAMENRDILSPIESLTPVDRHLAFRIWGIWSYRAGQAIHEGKLREKADRVEFQAIRDRLAETETRLVAARARVDALESSRWWRIGAPLRALGRRIGRF